MSWCSSAKLWSVQACEYNVQGQNGWLRAQFSSAWSAPSPTATLVPWWGEEGNRLCSYDQFANLHAKKKIVLNIAVDRAEYGVSERVIAMETNYTENEQSVNSNQLQWNKNDSRLQRSSLQFGSAHFTKAAYRPQHTLMRCDSLKGHLNKSSFTQTSDRIWALEDVSCSCCLLTFQFDFRKAGDYGAWSFLQRKVVSFSYLDCCTFCKKALAAVKKLLLVKLAAHGSSSFEHNAPSDEWLQWLMPVMTEWERAAVHQHLLAILPPPLKHIAGGQLKTQCAMVISLPFCPLTLHSPV